MEMPLRLRRWKRVVIPALVLGIAGFLASFLFTPKYTSRALVSQQPSQTLDVWGPVIIEDYEARLTTVQQQVLASDRLPRMIERIGVAKPGEEGRVLEKVRRNMRIEPALSGANKVETTASGKHAVPLNELLGFYVIYTDSSPRRAQAVCDGLTSVLLSVLIDDRRTQRIRQQDDTQRFLQSQQENARKELQAMHAQHIKNDRDQKLARDYEKTLKFSSEMLNKQRQAEAADQAATKSEGLLDMTSSPASLPESHVFRNLKLCTGAGLLVGLLLAIGLSSV